MPLNKPAAVLRALVPLSLLISAHPMAASVLSVFDNIYKTNKWGGTNISNATTMPNIIDTMKPHPKLKEF